MLFGVHAEDVMVTTHLMSPRANDFGAVTHKWTSSIYSNNTPAYITVTKLFVSPSFLIQKKTHTDFSLHFPLPSAMNGGSFVPGHCEYAHALTQPFAESKSMCLSWWSLDAVAGVASIRIAVERKTWCNQRNSATPYRPTMHCRHKTIISISISSLIAFGECTNTEGNQ